MFGRRTFRLTNTFWEPIMFVSRGITVPICERQEWHFCVICIIKQPLMHHVVNLQFQPIFPISTNTPPIPPASLGDCGESGVLGGKANLAYFDPFKSLLDFLVKISQRILGNFLGWGRLCFFLYFIPPSPQQTLRGRQIWRIFSPKKSMGFFVANLGKKNYPDMQKFWELRSLHEPNNTLLAIPPQVLFGISK